MKVQIEGNLYLESDGIEFTIKKYGQPYKNAKGETVEPFKTMGHFSSVQSAIRGLIKIKVMESTATTLNDLLKDVQRIERD